MPKRKKRERKVESVPHVVEFPDGTLVGPWPTARSAVHWSMAPCWVKGEEARTEAERRAAGHIRPMKDSDPLPELPT